MAITQDRMLALIADAVKANEAYENLKEDLKKLTLYEAKGEMTQEEVFYTILDMVKNLPTLPLFALAIEAKHFQKNAKSNERAKRHAAGKRILAGVKGREQSPTAEPWRTPQHTIKLDLPQGQQDDLVTLDEAYWKSLKAEGEAPQAAVGATQQPMPRTPQTYSDGTRVVDLSEMAPPVTLGDMAEFLPSPKEPAQ